MEQFFLHLFHLHFYKYFSSPKLDRGNKSPRNNFAYFSRPNLSKTLEKFHLSVQHDSSKQQQMIQKHLISHEELQLNCRNDFKSPFVSHQVSKQNRSNDCSCENRDQLFLLCGESCPFLLVRPQWQSVLTNVHVWVNNVYFCFSDLHARVRDCVVCFELTAALVLTARRISCHKLRQSVLTM